MPGPNSKPHGHAADGRRINGKTAMQRAGVTSCHAPNCDSRGQS